MSEVNIQINVTESVSPKNGATIDRPDLNLVGNTYSKVQVEDKLTSVAGTSYLGELPKTYNFPTTGSYTFNPIETGVYTINGHALPAITQQDFDNNLEVVIRVTNGVPSLTKKVMPSLPLTNIYNPSDNTKAGTMKSASDWVLNNYIGSYPLFKKPNLMDLPYPGFAVENGAAGLPNTLRYFHDYALLKDRYIHKIRAKASSLGGVYIFLYKISDLTAPPVVLTVNVTSTIFEYTFATPIDSQEYYVTFTSGFMYFPTSGAKPVKQLTPGTSNITDNATITIAVEYYTSPSLVLPPSDKISERLNVLESNQQSVDEFKWSNLMLDNTAIGKILVKESASSVFSLTDGKLSITSNNSGNGVVINNNIYLNKRTLEFDIKLSNINTNVYFGTKWIETNAGTTTYTVDFTTKKINGVTDFSAMDINTTDLYRISLSSIDFTSTVKVKNLRTAQEFTNTFSAIDMYDQYKIGFISGSGVIENIKIFSMAKDQPYIMFFGDSITRASNIANNKRFANLIGDLTGRTYLVSGRSAGTITGVLSRMAIEIPTFRPKYVCVTIGTNRGNTVDNLTALVNFCEKYDCKVILNRTPMFDGNTAAKNAMIDGIVSSRKLLSIKMDIATSVGFDGITKDNTCFSNESNIYIHPNEKGHQQIFERAKIDVEEVFISAGVLV